MEKSQKNVGNQDGKRYGIFGASGCGKTTKARNIISKSNRLIVFDSILAEWRDNHTKWLPRSVVVYSMPELYQVLKKKWSTGFRIVFVPTFGKESQQLDALAKYILQIQSGFGITHHANITFFIDEAQECIPAGTGLRNPSHGAIMLARMGRKKGVNMIVASQRIKTVDINVRANLNGIYIFRLEELADINEANQIIQDKNGLLSMKDYEFYYKSGGQIKFFKKS